MIHWFSLSFPRHLLLSTTGQAALLGDKGTNQPPSLLPTWVLDHFKRRGVRLVGPEKLTLLKVWREWKWVYIPAKPTNYNLLIRNLFLNRLHLVPFPPSPPIPSSAALSRLSSVLYHSRNILDSLFSQLISRTSGLFSTSTPWFQLNHFFTYFIYLKMYPFL